MVLKKKRFQENLAVALKAMDLNQVKFSSLIDVEKSTVNKWLKGLLYPNSNKIEEICRVINSHHNKDDNAPNISSEEITSLHPIEFGEMFGMTRNGIESAIGMSNDSIYINGDNFISKEDDYQLSKISGLYTAYMPSWVYSGVINQRLLNIYYHEDSYYYKEKHHSFKSIPSAEYSGYVGRVGENIHLIGEEMQGLREGRRGPREMMFASLRPFSINGSSALRGLCLGSDPVNIEMLPIASPYFAVKIRDTNSFEIPDELVPQVPYADINDESISTEVAELKKIKQSWFPSQISW